MTSPFSARLAQAIKNFGIPQKVVAHKSGYSEGYVRRLVTGEQANPSISTVAALATTLNVSPAWLAGWE